MSWLARSIANTLKFNDEDDDHHENNDKIEKGKGKEKDDQQQLIDSSSSPASPGRGIKEDISELTKTLRCQFWGVASFLAPPPSESPRVSDSNTHEQSDSAETSDPAASDLVGIGGIRSDFADIGGKFKSGISMLSKNIAVSEISKMASNFLQLGLEGEDYSVGNAVGITEEVVTFARDIAMHPETWLDFPLLEDDDAEDFDMSDTQQEHALAVEHLAPSLAALRIELCPEYMSEDCFWKIYFVLLHPRLNRNDAELLSTTQIAKARALLTHELPNHAKAMPEQDWAGRGNSYPQEVTSSPLEESLSVSTVAQSESQPFETSAIESTTSSLAADFETEKHPVSSTEIQIVDKSVIEEGPVNKTKSQSLHSSPSNVLEEKDEEDVDDWLKEESSDMVGAAGTMIPIENEEDVSFSDLEEDDGDIPTSYKKVMYSSDSSTKDSRDWVQLSRSSGDSVKDVNTVNIEYAGSGQVNARNPEIKDSNDWLDVDDIYVA